MTSDQTFEITKSLGIAAMADSAAKMGDTRAEMVVLIGLRTEDGETHFFEGRTPGTIVAPRGDKDFGSGPIFLPDGSEKTFGEMEREEKHAISMRGIAARKLKEFLERDL